MEYLEARNRYIDLASSRAYLNDKMNAGMFLSLTGAAAHDRGFEIQVLNRLDPRIHTLLIQPSRSGKGAAMAVANHFADMMGLSYTQEVQITDAALVGTVDGKIDQRNREKGYSAEDPEFVNPLILGAFGLYKVITFPEAKQMFKVGAHREDLMEIIQMALDSPGFVSKRLANNFPIKYKTDSTIIGTTYFLDEFEEILLKQGVFQRMMIMVDPFGIEKRMKLNKALIKKPDALIDYDKFMPAMQELADEVQEKMKSFHSGHVFERSESGEEALLKLEKERIGLIQNQFIGKDRELMLPYTTSVNNTHQKLACVAAILNGSDEITRREVLETQQDVEASFNCVINDIISRVSGVKPEKIQKMIRVMLSRQPKGLSIKEVKEKIEHDYHISQRQTVLAIRTMLNNQEIKKTKNRKAIQLNR